MENFRITDYQCVCPGCGRLMNPFHDIDGTIAYGCAECGKVIENEEFFLNLPLPKSCSNNHEMVW